MKLKVKKSRLWIPAAGIVIAFGFFNNCCLLPYLSGGEVVDWTNLTWALFIMLGIGSARDVAIRRFRYNGEVIAESQKTASKGFFTNKIWIPIIGWCLVGGLFNNCCVHPFFNINEVDWTWLLGCLAILTGSSGLRECGIYWQDKKVLDKEEPEASSNVRKMPKSEELSDV